MRASPRSLCTLILFGVAAAVPAFAQQGGGGVAATTPAPYPACTGKPTPADTDAAHGAYTAGKGSFDEADYTTAINYFRDAYRRDCTKPEILIILSRAYELQGNKREAVNALETYLARVPNASDSEVQRRHIANLKKDLSDQASAPSASPSASVAPSAVTSQAAPSASFSAPSPPALVEPPPPPAPDERHHTAPPWVVAGLGGAALVTGGVLFLVGSSDVSNAESVCGSSHDQCPPGSSSIGSGNSGRSLETTGAIVGGLGLGAIASGLLWHFLEPTGPSTSGTASDSARPVLVPQVGPGGYAGVGVGGRF